MKPYYEELSKPDADELSSYYQTERDLLLAIRSSQKLFSPSHAHNIPYESVKATA